MLQAEIGVNAAASIEVVKLRRPGRPTKEEQEEINKANNVRFIYGNNPSNAVARLQRDRPDLHERILAGDLSPHAAAVEGLKLEFVSPAAMD